MTQAADGDTTSNDAWKHLSGLVYLLTDSPMSEPKQSNNVVAGKVILVNVSYHVGHYFNSASAYPLPTTTTTTTTTTTMSQR